MVAVETAGMTESRIPVVNHQVERRAECWVVYLLVADNVSRLLPIRQRRVHQPVSSSQNGFSTPHSRMVKKLMRPFARSI